MIGEQRCVGQGRRDVGVGGDKVGWDLERFRQRGRGRRRAVGREEVDGNVEQAGLVAGVVVVVHYSKMVCSRTTMEVRWFQPPTDSHVAGALLALESSF